MPDSKLIEGNQDLLHVDARVLRLIIEVSHDALVRDSTRQHEGPYSRQLWYAVLIFGILTAFVGIAVILGYAVMAERGA